MAYTNSPLVAYTKLSPNHSGQRTHKIDRITPHCVVGQLSAERICGCFTSPQREASCNYGIGTDGRVSLCVEEKNRSWCSSSRENDQRAITIECASDREHPYAMNSAVYQSLINLCVDICKRNGISKLLWLGNKEKTLSYTPKPGEAVLTAHRWFANKACPGEWLYSRFGDLADKVNQKLGSKPEESHQKPDNGKVLYRVQTGAFSKRENADRLLDKVKAAGFDTYMVKADGLYKVQVGAYANRANAERQKQKLEAAGFETFITTNGGAGHVNQPINDVQVGSVVRVKNGATTYTGGSLASFVYTRNHKVAEISGDRVVITYNGCVVAAVKKADLEVIQ